MNPYREAPAPDVVCPRCDVGLTPRQVGDVRIDECPRCNGVFVPSHLMPRFQDTRDLGRQVMQAFAQIDVIPHPGGAMYVKCPRCGTRMNRRLFADGAKVVVDVCRGHGTWFDDGELRAVVEFIAGGGLARAAAKEWAEKDRLRKQARETALDLRQPEPSRGSGLASAAGSMLGGLLRVVLEVFFAWL